MKKFLQEVFTYFWIPLIMGLVSYVFFQLRDVVLGVIILIALSAIYTVVRLYFLHRKWWLLIILVVVVLASAGYFFTRSPSVTLTINGNPVTGSGVSVSGGAISITPPPQANGRYVKGVKVTLTAAPATGYDWKSWKGTENDLANPTTVTMSGNTLVTVNFEPRFSLIINNQLVIGSVVLFTEGSVSVNPVPGMDGKFARATEITLTAKPTSSYDWIGWSGTSDDKSNPTRVTMNGNKQITVDFEARFSLIISNQLVIGSSLSFPEGFVSVSPAPGPDDRYAQGTRVTLTATPVTGYGWKSWSGTGNDVSNPTTLTITSDKHIAVTFEQRFLLIANNQMVTGATTNVTGGSITVNPAPGTDGRYAKDAIVTLTAAPGAGYRFDRWSGDATGNTASTTINMNSNKSVTATFIKVYPLATSVSPAGGGSVSPASGTYDEGATVILTATPTAGYRFDHWSSDASGNVTTITLNMNANKSVTANFIKTWVLTTPVSPVGGGTVSPAGGTYDESTNVTLTATPASGFLFDRWSGDASGNITTVTITMNADKSVTANFTRGNTLTVSVSPGGGGSVSPSGGIYAPGASVTLTATAAAGYRFDHWSGDAAGTSEIITLIMDADKNVAAVFVPAP